MQRKAKETASTAAASRNHLRSTGGGSGGSRMTDNTTKSTTGTTFTRPRSFRSVVLGPGRKILYRNAIIRSMSASQNESIRITLSMWDAGGGTKQGVPPETPQIGPPGSA